MSHPYADSIYAHERVGWDLHCEARPGFPLAAGAIPMCRHCGNEFAYEPGNPKPCIERIAMALEEARGPASNEPDDAPPSPDAPAPRPTDWLREAVETAPPWTPPEGWVVIDEPAPAEQPWTATPIDPVFSDALVAHVLAARDNGPTFRHVDVTMARDKLPPPVAAWVGLFEHGVWTTPPRVALTVHGDTFVAEPRDVKPDGVGVRLRMVEVGRLVTLPEGWTPPGQREPAVRWRNARITPGSADEFRVETSAPAHPFEVGAFLVDGWATRDDGFSIIAWTEFEGPGGSLRVEARLPHHLRDHVYTRDEVIAALNEAYRGRYVITPWGEGASMRLVKVTG